MAELKIVSRPVSRNRQFGLKTLDNGSYEFYIRAADCARISWIVRGISVLGGQNSTEIFYEITDQAWGNLTSNIAALVNDPEFGGEGSTNTPVIVRPDWNAVKEVLKSGDPFNLPCKY